MDHTHGFRWPLRRVMAEEVNARDAGCISEWGFFDTFVPQPQSSHYSPTQISENVKGKAKIYVPFLLNNSFIHSNIECKNRLMF